MTPEGELKGRVQIGHVLIMDVVAYSTLLIDAQTRVLSDLNRIVRETRGFREGEVDGKLLCLPTGDGMALVFFDDPEAPIECAMQISTAIKSHPDIGLRMGIHSGPVNRTVDVNQRLNITGAGIDVAQRVMDCGDAGHILLSRRAADDLAPLPRWNPHLHDLGECDVKHGRKVSLVNFYTAEVGNPARPNKCASAAAGRSTSARSSALWKKRVLFAGAALLVIALGLAALVFSRPKLLPWWTNAGVATTQSIAVLPFENANSDPNTEYLSDGISEALINSLAELPQLRVIARATAFRYKGKDVDPRRVGRELQVAAVLTGKVRQMQDALNVQVDLVNAATGAQIWAQGTTARLRTWLQSNRQLRKRSQRS